MKNIIEVKNLRKSYHNNYGDTEVLKGLNFSIKEKEFVAIMGPSGSGKSTLMHILGALDIASQGDYWLDGINVSTLNDEELSEIRNKKIGFVFQAFNLLPKASVLKNVCLPAIYAGVDKKTREKKALECIEIVKLEDRINHLSNQISGGQQQRVAIARALIMTPSIILADEPTGNLPSDQSHKIMKVFQDLNKKGHTIVMITHEDDIASYANRIIHLKDGVILRK
jgi:putative ABC transport system ATP-binding protein